MMNSSGTVITFEELASKIISKPHAHRQRMIAIDGGGGAGKTTFAAYLQKAIPGSQIVKVDDFYRPPQLRTPLESTKVINPNFDWDRLRTSVLEAVVKGKDIRYQLYDFEVGTLSGPIISVPADATIIVEGVWSFQKMFVDYYDYRIWMEAPADVRLERGVAREGEKWRQVWVDEWIPIDEYYQQTYQPQLQADCVVDSVKSDFSIDKIILRPSYAS